MDDTCLYVNEKQHSANIKQLTLKVSSDFHILSLMLVHK